MKVVRKTINRISFDVVEVVYVDDDEIALIKKQYYNSTCIQIGMSNLEYLALFCHIDTLIITGGEPSDEGIKTLYALSELNTLVLDYEETDTDLDGIDLNRFPSLKYVLSRSNLNIHNYSECSRHAMTVEVVNTYHNGKPIRIKAAPTTDICAFHPDLFLSTESCSPASRIIMDILNSIRPSLSTFQARNYSSNIDFISIIPICMPERLISDGFGKERRRVSLKKHFAEIRLRIDWDAFSHATQDERQQMCIENIEQSAYYISTKDSSFDLVSFCHFIRTAFREARNK